MATAKGGAGRVAWGRWERVGLLGKGGAMRRNRLERVESLEEGVAAGKGRGQWERVWFVGKGGDRRSLLERGVATGKGRGHDRVGSLGKGGATGERTDGQSNWERAGH